jgi:acyl transferase domain-containing protein
VILSLQHDEIPKQLHFEKPNQKIAWEELPVRVAKEAVLWRRNNGRRIAGVSGFAFQGSNAHVVIEEAPEKPTVQNEVERPLHLLTLSAMSEGALKELVERYIKHLEKHKDQQFGDICFTANFGRSHFDYRLALVAKDRKQAIEQLKAHKEGRDVAGLWLGKGSRDNEKPNILVTDSDPHLMDNLSNLAKFYVHGYNISFLDFDREYLGHKVSLPHYPFERKRYWIKGSPLM